jgi:signal transduction histidine kinase
VKSVVSGSRRVVVFDAVVVLIALGLSFSVSLSPSILKPYGGATFAVLAVVALSLVFRRRAPLTVVWIAVAVAAVLPAVEFLAPGTLVRSAGVSGPVLWWPPAAPFAAYSAMAFSPRRFAAWVPVVMLVVCVILVAPMLPQIGLEQHPQNLDPPYGIAYRSSLAIFGGALLGLYFGARGRLMLGLVERAERAERERHLLAERTRAEERARLAAEMHDVITHRVSLMVVQAGALGVTTHEEATRTAAEELRATGCQALAELRDAVGLLRRDASAATSPDPAAAPLPDLTSLITESKSVGIPVEVVEEGDRALASPVVGRTAYRVVQEALTNVRKHAPGARVRVSVRYRQDGVRLTIHNTPPTRAVDAMLTAAGSGVGLSGLRQRVELVNGTLEVGPSGDGGFCVDATLPTFLPTAGALEFT